MGKAVPLFCVCKPASKKAPKRKTSKKAPKRKPSASKKAPKRKTSKKSPKKKTKRRNTVSGFFDGLGI